MAWIGRFEGFSGGCASCTGFNVSRFQGFKVAKLSSKARAEAKAEAEAKAKSPP
jgi:hypothetical protein